LLLLYKEQEVSLAPITESLKVFVGDGKRDLLAVSRVETVVRTAPPMM